MSSIKQIPVEEATGALKDDNEIKRLGRLFQIVHTMSKNPSTLNATGGLYKAIMDKDSPLSRIQREMLATVVSAELASPYSTQAHVQNLRAEMADIEDDEFDVDAFVDAIAHNWREASLSPADGALCEFAAKVTHDQQNMKPQDLDLLRTHGFEDRTIHHAVQLIGFFNYISHIADALGIEPEALMESWDM